MSSIMRARSGLIGRGEVSEVIGLFSRAEGCWTFDARDQMPRSSRATALHLVENVPTETCAPPARAGSFCAFVTKLAASAFVTRLAKSAFVAKFTKSAFVARLAKSAFVAKFTKSAFVAKLAKSAFVAKLAK